MIHARQFIISQKQKDLPEYLQVRLSDGYFLSYHKELPVYVHERSDILLLGLAWQVRADRMEPVREIERLAGAYPEKIPEHAVLSMEESWCGRYVLIVQGRVYLDATGLLGIFYGKGGISGSCRLLADSMGLPARNFRPASGMNWLPGPLTQYGEIRRLLPDQIYDYRSGRVRGRQLLAADVPECAGEEERIERFSDCFVCSLKNMAELIRPRKMLIALTGGYDSRTLLAFAKRAGIPFECFTLKFDGMPADDAKLPEELCRVLKCGHISIPRDTSRYSQKREEDYLQHTSGLADDGDKLHYAYGQYQELTDRFGSVALLRSSVWEVAIDYLQKIAGESFQKEYLFLYYEIPGQALERDSLEEYFQWAKQYRQNGLSGANRFFWEQRYGSWLSSIEQSFDLMDGMISLHPVNSRYLLTMLLGFPKEERIVKKHQVKLISHACPELAEIPFSGDRPVNKSRFFLPKKKVKEAVGRLRRLGLKRTAGIYRNMIRMKIQKRRSLKKDPGKDHRG